ncbi:MAG: lipopolysaccharide biosynthesis protein [Deltaproteobacteria bacterium]|nr:lipopolysaccharide biosynthesis protein [Deltaproteobacteria bacterium]
MNTPDSTPNPALPAPPEMVPLDLLIVVGRHKRLVARITIATAALSIVASLLLPRTFTAATRILPPQQGQSTAAALLGQLGGGLAGMASGALGIKNPSDLYIGMLKSQAVADPIIERLGLRELWSTQYFVDARVRLAGSTRFLADKSGIITIEVEARTPALAADIANAYVEQLHRLTGTLAVTEAGQRRIFFERQLQQTKEKLADAEVKLRQAIESGGLVSVDAQGRAAVETVARLRAQISAKEIQIGAMKGYAAAGNPDLQRAERELSSMRQELTRLESGIPGGEGGASIPGDAKGVANIRLMREVKYQEVMFELLAKQYELARVDEAKEAPVIQVLDKATPPERKSGPKRAVIVIGSTLAGLLAGVVVAFARNALESARQDPAQRGRLEALRAAWRKKSS